MKAVARLVLIAALTLHAVTAWAQGATNASIERLLEVMQVERLLQSMFENIRAMQQAQFEKIMADSTKSEEEKKKLQELRQRVARIVADELSYANLKPIYVDAFQRVYSDEDVSNLIVFYESPTGRKFLEKQPQLMQESFAAMQQRMQSIMQRITREIEEARRK